MTIKNIIFSCFLFILNLLFFFTMCYLYIFNNADIYILTFDLSLIYTVPIVYNSFQGFKLNDNTKIDIFKNLTKQIMNFIKTIFIMYSLIQIDYYIKPIKNTITLSDFRTFIIGTSLIMITLYITIQFIKFIFKNNQEEIGEKYEIHEKHNSFLLFNKR